MELKEYQELASRTAEPRAYDFEYLIPGIVSEVGELLGQQAKAHWHGWGTDRLNDAVRLEYGDIAWLTALLLKTFEKYSIEPGEQRRGPEWVGTLDPTQIILQRASTLRLFWASPETPPRWLQGEAVSLWTSLEYHCHTITGTSFDHVLQMNLDKLASRAERNVLRGAGDYR